MATAHVTLPAKLDLESVLRFASELDRYGKHEEVILSVGEQRWFPPFSMLFLAAKLRQLRRDNPALSISVPDGSNQSFIGHMGFFRMFGVDHGREIGEANGSSTYLPITCVKRETLYVAPTDKYEELGDLIQRHADKVSEIISRDYDHKDAVFDVLSYSIREVMRNVFEHGQTDEVYYCGQYWPQKNRVEVSIADLGIGIRRALSENPNFRFNRDKEALEMSLLPTVSGKTHLGRTTGNWFNSGYGLYMTNRLARNGGNFVIASGKSAIHLSPKSKRNYQTSFAGTALRLNFSIDEIGSMKDRLEEFRKDGAKLAATISAGGNRPPSGVSLLLRRDFT